MAIPLETAQRVLGDRFRIDRHLGGGGMCDVFSGFTLEGDRQVALKILRPEYGTSILSDRFLQEIALLSELEHPHILRLLESSKVGAFIYYVMPFAEGGSLHDRLQRDRTLTLEEARSITRDVAEGIDHAHANGVIHRDIKPHNVMFHEGRAAICDFGVARAMVRAAGQRFSTSGLVVGTPYYMSPEQARGGSMIDHRADIYSLGCVVYQMLVGEPPFTGRSAQAVMAKHLREQPPSICVVRPEVPKTWEAAIVRALAKDPNERPESAGEFAGLMEA